jgi:hypothetical protein
MSLETEYDNKCRQKYYETLEGLVQESGYSRSQIATVMVVMDCDKEEAMRLLKKTEKYETPDWSEWTWEEFRSLFMEVKKLI